MKTYTYDVLAFRQQEHSPIQVAFVAYAGEVMDWVGVPRKSDELLTGYQRFLDPNRINQQIVPFFQNPRNSSPTAIIVALRRDSGLGKCTLEASDVPAGKVILTKLHIEIDNTALDTDDVFVSALEYVNSRLAANSPSTSSTVEDGESDEDEEELLVVDEETEDESEEIAHLGTVTLQRMKELLDDKSNWTNPGFKSAIVDYVKPAFIIDGQHRIGAAAKIGMNGLPFMICGLYDAPWEEQVFQFTVVNLRPKRIPPSLITSIAGLSLTRDEQDKVEQRLKQAGVEVVEVAIMSLVAYDETSPFAEKVDMQVGGPKDREDKLGYGTVKRITKEWYNANRTSLTQIAKVVYGINSAGKARNRWKDERLWFDFFCTFWSAIREHYPVNLWQKTPENRLFIGAHLWALQEVILRQADGQVPSHWQIKEPDVPFEERVSILKDKLLEVVNTTLNFFPEELWTIAWTKVSQDTNAGREDLILSFNKFVDEGKKAGFWKAWKSKSDLVKE
jgi:hypothetical protein